MTPESPEGIDLNPEPDRPARISRRAMFLIGGIVLAVIAILIYGGEWRRSANRRAAAEKESQRQIEAANPNDVIRSLGGDDSKANPTAPPQANIAPPLGASADQLVQPFPPGQRTQAYEPPAFPRFPGGDDDHAVSLVHARSRREDNEPSPADREKQARYAPTAVGGDRRGVLAVEPPIPTSAPSHGAAAAMLGAANRTEPADEYALTNVQARKEAFLASAKGRSAGNYLQYTRTGQVGLCEIKAGWEIPAVLEQEINSDLPGEMKALVTQNVYDTATGKYLLIPQGSRLIGKYSSDVSYGQTGVQVLWDRIIYPDGSSINLDGMTGMDAQGNAGLRGKVDRHYRRTLGMAFLASVFVAAYEMANRRTYGGMYGGGITATDAATGAMGREITNTGAMMTRRNLNVQPTIKVPTGYRFTVRVNRDMLFAGPYEPQTIEAEPMRTRPHLQRTAR